MADLFPTTETTKSARERVVRRLLKAFGDQKLEPGTRLPPSRALAETLGASLSTVQAAIRELAAKGVVRTEVGNGSFLIALPGDAEVTGYRIALSLPPVEERFRWAARISEAVLNGAIDAPRHLSFFSLGCAAHASEEEIKAVLAAKCPLADALILAPHPRADLLREGFLAAGKPVIHFNAPHPGATTQFVSPDYYGSALRLAEAWRTVGRREVVLLTFGQLRNSVSSLQRSLGLMAGIGGELGRGIRYRVEEAPETLVEDGYRSTARLFSGAEPPPDAIYCVGDHLALGVLDWLREHGMDDPGKISVVGGSGNLEGAQGETLTAIRPPYEAVGKAMVTLLLKTLEEAGRPQPAVYLPCTFRLGASTTAEENALLTASHAPGGTSSTVPNRAT